MIEKLQNTMNEKRTEVLAWLSKKTADVTLPIYASFDVRDNGTKASIVDSNLFPAGFNNLTDESKTVASEYFKEYLSKICDTKKILVIPEAHTRNKFYLANLNSIKKILEQAQYTVTLGSIREDIETVLEVEDSNGETLVLEKMENNNGCLKTQSFEKGLILLNNDFSVPAPQLLHDVKNPIMPPLELGWTHRKKYSFFRHFCSLLHEFGDAIGFDCWLLCPITREVNNVDFKTKENMQHVAKQVDEVIAKIQSKYDQYNISEKPFVFVKDNSGTYGMGIITVESGQEILELNSKNRRKMDTGKERSKINSVIIQEGISTKHTLENATAEPVLYCVAGKVVGGFMRVHESKDDKSSLNAPGAKFDILLEDNITRPIIEFIDENQELSIYKVLAQIGCVAIAKEMEDAQ